VRSRSGWSTASLRSTTPRIEGASNLGSGIRLGRAGGARTRPGSARGRDPPRSSALRTSHNPGPQNRRYPRSDLVRTPRGLGSQPPASTRRSRQGGAPHRTNDLDGDKRRRTLQRVETAPLTQRGTRSGRGEGTWPPCMYERSRDATATCCGVSVSPGFIPRARTARERPGPAPPAAVAERASSERDTNCAVGTVMGRSSAAEICLVGPFAGRTG
jgi:hypothetical protein